MWYFFSWQLISGTGSPNGTTSVRDSPISALGHGSSTTSLWVTCSCFQLFYATWVWKSLRVANGFWFSLDGPNSRWMHLTNQNKHNYYKEPIKVWTFLQPAQSAGKRVWAKVRVVFGLFLIGWNIFWLLWLVIAHCTWFFSQLQNTNWNTNSSLTFSRKLLKKAEQ